MSAGRHRLIPPLFTRRNVLRTLLSILAVTALFAALLPARSGDLGIVAALSADGGTDTATPAEPVDRSGTGDPIARNSSGDVDDKGQPVDTGTGGTGSGGSGGSGGTGTGTGTEPGTGEPAQDQPTVDGSGTDPMVMPMPRNSAGQDCVDKDAEIIEQNRDTVTVKEPIHACGTPYFPTKSAIGARDGSGQLLRSPTGFGYEPMPEHPDTEDDTANRARGTANPTASNTGAACSTVLDAVQVSDTTAEAGNKIIKETGYDGAVLGKGSRTISTSDHPAGYAIDFLVGTGAAGKVEGDRIRDYVMNNSDELGLLYLIWRQTYYNHRGSSAMENRGSVTANHFDHVHVSFKRTPLPAQLVC
jgi:hypothetical protein